MTPERWIIAALVLVLAAMLAFGSGHDDTYAEQERARLEAVVDSTTRAADQAQAHLAAYKDTADQRIDSLAATQRKASQRAQNAAETHDSLQTQARTLAQGNDSLVAVLDGLATAHGEEVAALRDQLAAKDSISAILFHRIEISDSVIAEKDRQIAAIRAERDHLASRLDIADKRVKSAERKAKIVMVLSGGVVAADAIASVLHP